MKIKTSQKIIEYIKNRGQATGSELADFLNISDRAVRKQLNNLLESDLLYKNGKPPKVFYFIKKAAETIVSDDDIAKDIKLRIDRDFLIITPSGDKKEGLAGFKYWCAKNNLPLDKTAKEYFRTVLKYDNYKKEGLISGIKKINNTFNEIYLDELFYLDFYSIEMFGKTKLGQLLLYAKQSQNRILMKEIIEHIKPNIDKIIKKFKIDGIGFIPPTVKREVQLMKVLERGLNENLRKLSISKIKTMVAVPQKTLNKLVDRIENAKKTIVVEDNSTYKNILLIDDAVGSGATLNETAKKIVEKKICKGRIIGVAITGSFNGFDVISEV